MLFSLAQATDVTDMPTIIFKDNQSSIAMTKNPQFHGCAKHIDFKHHFIREHVSRGTVQLEYCPMTDMTADILTNVKDAYDIAESKYDPAKHTIVFVFDQSNCHTNFDERELIAKNILHLLFGEGQWSM